MAAFQRARVMVVYDEARKKDRSGLEPGLVGHGAEFEFI